MEAKCSDQDIPFLRALVYSVKSSLANVCDSDNCGIASNWQPILALASMSFLVKEFEFSICIQDLAKLTLPLALQDLPDIELIFGCLDPENEVNLDADDSEHLKLILQANERDVVRTIELISDEDSGFSLQKEAANLRDRIYKFLATEFFNDQESSVKEKSRSTSVVKKLPGKWSRPRGKAPFSVDGNKQEWDYECGDWVEVETKKRQHHAINVESSYGEAEPKRAAAKAAAHAVSLVALAEA